MIQAFDQVHAIMVAASFNVEDWVKLEWVPKKILTAKIDIHCSLGPSASGQERGKGSAFCLVPFTNQLKGIDPDVQCGNTEIKTDVTIPHVKNGDVLVLKEPTNYDVVMEGDATTAWHNSHGDFILDAFWKMDRTIKEEQANMKMSQVTVTLGYSATLPGIAERGGSRYVYVYVRNIYIIYTYIYI